MHRMVVPDRRPGALVGLAARIEEWQEPVLVGLVARIGVPLKPVLVGLAARIGVPLKPVLVGLAARIAAGLAGFVSRPGVVVRPVAAPEPDSGAFLPERDASVVKIVVLDGH